MSNAFPYPTIVQLQLLQVCCSSQCTVRYTIARVTPAPEQKNHTVLAAFVLSKICKEKGDGNCIDSSTISSTMLTKQTRIRHRFTDNIFKNWFLICIRDFSFRWKQMKYMTHGIHETGILFWKPWGSEWKPFLLTGNLLTDCCVYSIRFYIGCCSSMESTLIWPIVPF